MSGTTQQDQQDVNDVETEVVETPTERKYSALTPYHAAMITQKHARKREWVNKDGTPFTMSPQSMYSRAAKGTIASNYKVQKALAAAKGSNRAEGLLFEGASFAAWLRAYLSNEGRSARVDNSALYDEYADV